MPRNLRAAACLLAVLASVTVSASLLPAQDSGSSSAVDELIKTLLTSEDAEKVLYARTRLQQWYAEYDDSSRGPAFSRMIVERVAPALGAVPHATAATIDRVRLANMAILLGSMPQVNVQPALQQMVVHANPGVRLWGWKGYLRARTLMLRQGEAAFTPMFAALAASAQNESAAPVLGSMFSVLRLDPTPPDGLDAAAWNAWRAQVRQTLAGGVARWADMVGRGDPEMAVAAATLPTAIRNYAATLDREKDKATLAELAQMAYTLAAQSSYAYKEAGYNTPVANANALLLRDVEAALNDLAGLNQTFIEAALSRAEFNGQVMAGADPYAAAVRLAVITSWKNALGQKGFAVQTPKDPAPLPAPVAKPAARPTTQAG